MISTSSRVTPVVRSHKTNILWSKYNYLKRQTMATLSVLYFNTFFLLATASSVVLVEGQRRDALPDASLSRHLQESLLDFSVGGVSMTVTPAVDNPALWDIDLDYTNYNGSPIVTSSVAILTKDCMNAVDSAMIYLPQLDPPAQFPGDGTFHVDLQADIILVKDDVSLWTYSEDDLTRAQLAFCVRVDIFYETVLVNLAKTQATIDITGAAGFSSSQVAIQSATTLTASDETTVSYDVKVFPCNPNSLEVPADPVAPGTAVRLCVKLADENLQNVFVQNVEEVAYSSDGVTSVPVIDSNGPINPSLALLKCVAESGGFCRFEFIPSMDAFEAGGSLTVTGTVTIGFVSHTDTPVLRRALLRTRRGEVAASESATFSFRVMLDTTEITEVSRQHHDIDVRSHSAAVVTAEDIYATVMAAATTFLW